MGYRPEPSTVGGTSDGRFIAPTGAQVLELGAINASIHQVDEHVPLADLLDAMLLQGKTLEQEAVPVERLANCWRN